MGNASFVPTTDCNAFVPSGAHPLCLGREKYPESCKAMTLQAHRGAAFPKRSANTWTVGSEQIPKAASKTSAVILG